MLAGYECHEQVKITDRMMEMAMKRLRAFLFVGVTDRYAEGVRAFHTLSKRGTSPVAAELRIYRAAGSYTKQDDKWVNTVGETKKAMYAVFDELNWSDPFDAKIYEIAEEMFNKTLRQIFSATNQHKQKIFVPTKPKILGRERAQRVQSKKEPLIRGKGGV
jgi:hypothetical protein